MKKKQPPPRFIQMAHTKTASAWAIDLGVSYHTIKRMCASLGVSCAPTPRPRKFAPPPNWSEIAPTKSARAHAIDFRCSERCVRRWCDKTGAKTLGTRNDQRHKDLMRTLAAADEAAAEAILDSLHRDTSPHMDDPHLFYQALRAFRPGPDAAW